MGGGLMQLVAYGAQDIYLTGNPQITFFKVVYRRHTNFSMETIEQTILGSNQVSSDNSVGNITISRNGDLVHKIYVTMDREDSHYVNITDGTKLINKVDLLIGGQVIDTQTNEWMNVWNELTIPSGKRSAFKYMTHATGKATDLHADNQSTGHYLNMIQIPLLFWFCRNPGLALPLIALQYHSVDLRITLGTSTEVGGTVGYKVLCDYIFLDTDERRRFAQVSHEYLIEQIQLKEESNTTNTSVDLKFNHPVKELIWTTPNENPSNQQTSIEVNGNERFRKMYPEYFQMRQPFDYHTVVPRINYKDHNSHSGIALATPINVFGGSASGTLASSLSTANHVQFLDSTGTVTVFGNPASFIKFLNPTNFAEIEIGCTLNIENTTSGGNALHTTLGKLKVIQIDDKTVKFSTNITSPHGSMSNGNTISVKITEKNFLSDVSLLDKRINVYSFALKPEEHQPSGTCNFSRLDSAKLKFDTSNGAAINIYAINYNVLRIMSGMGGLAYSN
jgi:hypothetical protein